MECTAIPMVRNYRAAIRGQSDESLLVRHKSDTGVDKDKTSPAWTVWRRQMKIELSRRGLGS